MAEIATKSTPRRITIKKREDFDGYGFNLHAEKGKPGQYVGKVDANSPAELAGLREGDRIIEVNGIDIGSETHKQVVERIKAVPNETTLLVIDPHSFTGVTKNGNATSPSMTQSETVEKRTSSSTLSEKSLNNNNNENDVTDATSDTVNNEKSPTKDSHANNSAVSVVSNNETTTMPTNETIINGSNNASPIAETKTETGNHHQTNNHHTNTTTTTITTEIENNNHDKNHENNGNAANGKPVTTQMETQTKSSEKVLNLNMTATELRAKLLAKKKYDPKNDSIDLRKKYDIIQKM
uniref:CSON003303 protein n=1 Tax=Culicoides sonorensis TaxID=179676 RepID=A0A336MMF2_CULSO